MIARRRRKRLGMGNKNNHQIIRNDDSTLKQINPTENANQIGTATMKSAKQKAGGMNITIMLLAVVFFFFICQFPNLILHIITSMICTNENTKCSASGFYQYSLATSKLLLICNLSFNFIIYCLFSEKFRDVLKKKLNFTVKKNSGNEMTSRRASILTLRV